jgi:ADP-dependent NAD(P)H-hydrate dehydratase / NAD(P)H-hydrate epimerase
MDPVLTPAQMREADAAAIAAGTSGVELMDRASHACAVVALRMLRGGYGKRVAIVCGKGNNGGDGVACARHLASAGVSVTVLLLAELEGDAAAHLSMTRTLTPPGRARIAPWSPESFARVATQADLVIDAIFGTGFSGAPRGEAAVAIEAIGACRRPVLAIDIASGVSGSDGAVPGAAVRADVTVAIQALKPGHVMPPGTFGNGRVDVADIGIPVRDVHAFVPNARDVRGVLPETEPDTHKYRVGALAVLAGSAGMTGAAVLTARGAIRSGAGLVMLGIAASALEVAEAAVVEAIKVPLPDVEGQLDEKAVDEFADRLEKCRALAIGPGLGRGPRAVAVVRRALDVELPLVIDGDGLWALAEVMKEEPDVLRAREHGTVLTPHTGEFAFLAGRGVADDRITDVRERADEWGAVVHLKGRRAITASPSGSVWVNPTGNPGAATAGSGDVLTGILGSLLAQGMMPEAATWAGAYVHGAAADLVAGRLGERGLASGDLPDAVAHALRTVDRAVYETARLRTVIRP